MGKEVGRARACVPLCVCVGGGGGTRKQCRIASLVVGADFTEKVIIEGRRRRR